MIKNSVPALRFAGFDVDWIQRNFSDLAETRRGLTYSPNDVRSSGIRVLRSSNISEDHFVFGDDDVFVAPEAINIPLVHEGDILITAANGSTRLVGKHAIIRDIAEGSSVHGGFMLLASTENPDFVNALMSAPWYSKFISLYVAGGNGAIGNLNKSDLDEQAVFVPDDPEQKMIGRFFNYLDSLVSQHHRQFDRLVQTKKAMLLKMFPRQGKCVPELRFSDYTDAWKQHMLSELLQFQNGFNGSSDSFGSGTPLISVMDILGDGFITYNSIRGSARLSPDELKRYSVDYGDVLFQRSSETFEDAGTSNVYLDKENPAVFGGFVIRGKKISEYDPIFMKYLLSTTSVRSQITSRAQGAQHINVSQNTLSDVVVTMPKIEEQRDIGHVLYELDKISTLHKQKIKSLTNLKSALLQKMFPDAEGSK